MESGEAKVPLIPKIKSLDEVVFQALKGYFVAPKDSLVCFSPNSPKIT